MGNGTFVGLDVHARSVVAGLIDERSGEVRVKRVAHRTEDLVSWLGDLERPVRVAYEAGPTGFGLARACEAAGRLPGGRAQPDRALAGGPQPKERRL